MPGSGRPRGLVNVNPLQFSCLENSMNRGAWQATGRGVAESDTTDHMYTDLWQEALLEQSGATLGKMQNVYVLGVSGE